jgi:hypothetical protein
MKICTVAALSLVLFCRVAQPQQQSQPVGDSEIQILPARGMPSKECGVCHETQYKGWSAARHCQRGVTCASCHGEFHSGSLSGCLKCHTGKHKLQYQNWEFVKDYMVEGDDSDYYCITCHDPHNPVKEKVLVCVGCHGNSTAEMLPRKTVLLSLQSSHNALAGIALNMDHDTWNRRFKSTGGKLLFGGGALLAGGVLMFPYFYTLFAFARWAKKRRKKD